jgi:hypothetical protein
MLVGTAGLSNVIAVVFVLVAILTIPVIEDRIAMTTGLTVSVDMGRRLTVVVMTVAH